MTSKDTFKTKVLKMKKITGFNAGRILIQDLVKSYENSVLGKHNGLLTQAEKAAIVNKVEGRNDIRDYNALKNAHDFLLNYPHLYGLARADFSRYIVELTDKVTNAYYAEREMLFRLATLPCIVTQKEYDNIKENAMAEKLTMQELIIETIAYFWQLYEKGEKTPLDRPFKKYAAQKVTNESIVEMGPLSANREKDAPFTGADIFAYINSYYGSEQAPEFFWELPEDYPELYNAALKYVLSFKDLGAFSKLQKKQYTNKGIVDRRTLYKADFCNSRELVDKVNPAYFAPEGKNFSGGVAILQDRNWGPDTEGKIDEKGNYIFKAGPSWKAFAAENYILTPERKEYIAGRLEQIRVNLTILYGLHMILEKIGAFLDIDNVGVLITPIETSENALKGLNAIIDIFIDAIICPLPNREVDEIQEQCRATLLKVDPAQCKGLAEKAVECIDVNMTSFEEEIYTWTFKLYKAAEEGGVEIENG